MKEEMRRFWGLAEEGEAAVVENDDGRKVKVTSERRRREKEAALTGDPHERF